MIATLGPTDGRGIRAKCSTRRVVLPDDRGSPARENSGVQPATAAAAERVELRDGSPVFIRPIEADDKGLLVRGFEMLSPESRYRRFLHLMMALDPRTLVALTEVDHHSHEALVAVAPDGEPVGVARFICLDDPREAEVAVAVTDRWQGRGAGTALLARLRDRARHEGVRHFAASCLAENHDVLDLLEQLGPFHLQKPDMGTVELRIDLEDMEALEGPVRAAFRHAAAGRIQQRTRHAAHALRTSSSGT
jgi:GNAT superfamily N-acetyltransferase